jgi:hypothetical protein
MGLYCSQCRRPLLDLGGVEMATPWWRVHGRKACGRAARRAGQRTCFGRGERSRSRDGFYFNLNGN